MKHRFIFHIGPIKTGSTSIQSFLEREDQVNPDLEYKRIKPDHFFNLTSNASNKESQDYFLRVFKRKAKMGVNRKTCIFSHECMYQKPSSLLPLIEAARPFSDDISVIAYVR